MRNLQLDLRYVDGREVGLDHLTAQVSLALDQDPVPDTLVLQNDKILCFSFPFKCMVRLGGETEISLVTYLSSVCRATLLLLSELTHLIFSIH